MQTLRQLPPPVTAEQLAQDLGVSARTIHRDIDALRALGAVIDGAAGFGFTLIEDATLPPLGFGATELEALVLGLCEVQQKATLIFPKPPEPPFASCARVCRKAKQSGCSTQYYLPIVLPPRSPRLLMQQSCGRPPGRA